MVIRSCASRANLRWGSYKLMRVAVFGLGGVAERIHLPACKSVAEAEIVGACEPDEARRLHMAKQFALIRTYPDAVTLLEREKPELAIVGSPPDSHKDLCLLALSAGAHVFCEKPFTPTVAEADEVIVAARRAGLAVRVNNQYRYMPFYRETGERIHASEFGPLYFIQFWQQMFHPPSYEKDWRARLKQSTLFEFGTHAVDLSCYFFDALPSAVSAAIPRVPQNIDADVLVQMTLRFPEERVAAFSFNRVSRAPFRYLEARLDCTEASIRVSLGGVARASIQWASERRLPTLRASLVSGGESRAESGGRSRTLVKTSRPAFASATASHLREFITEISAGKVNLAPVMQSREILRTALAGYEAARTGETIWLEANRRDGTGGTGC
jgi:predicted dehydrogenase